MRNGCAQADHWALPEKGRDGAEPDLLAFERSKVYICNKINDQYQATVQIQCLPEEWGERAWAGHLCPNKQKAEQSAAEIALKDIKGGLGSKSSSSL